jgi:hypothetical protein
VLYELALDGLHLRFAGGIELDVTDTLTSGRVNYALFQSLVGRCAGLSPHSEGGAADLVAGDGTRYEVKAYFDHVAHPGDRRRVADIHTAASSTFSANNHGPRVAALLAAGRYDDALGICSQLGYAHNDYYVYTNTRGYTPAVPLRYTVVATSTLLDVLSGDDPRVVPRASILGLVTRTETIDPAVLPASGA